MVKVMINNLFALAQQLGECCIAKDVRIAMAESCTGGMVSEVMTAVPGSSAWFEAGFVVYSNSAKTRMLGVDAELVNTYGAVSEPVARAMAEGVLRNTGADYSVAVTGVAGPDGGSKDKPVGIVWFALADRLIGECMAVSVHLEGGRRHIRQCATAYVLAWLQRHMKG